MIFLKFIYESGRMLVAWSTVFETYKYFIQKTIKINKDIRTKAKNLKAYLNCISKECVPLSKNFRQ